MGANWKVASGRIPGKQGEFVGSAGPKNLDVRNSAYTFAIRNVGRTDPLVSSTKANQGRLPVPRLTILIPALSTTERLEHTLVSVLGNRPARCEIVVVLGHPYDDPYHLVDEVAFVQAPEGAGLSECVNLGWRESTGPIVHVLSCGAAVAEGWADAALAHFCDWHVAAVAPLVLDDAENTRVISAGLEYHRAGIRRLRARG
jgi:hypothetical protein